MATAHQPHHDGRRLPGPPRGLGGVDIDLDVRIVTVADIFDALTAERPYRPAMPVSRAFEIMDGDVGTAIDPLCLNALKRAMSRLTETTAEPPDIPDVQPESAPAVPLRLTA